MPRPASIPRPYTKSGQWVVVLRDRATGSRRTIYLGPPDTPESRQRYAEALADWEASDRVVPPSKGGVRRKVHRTERVVVADIVLGYWKAIQSRHTDENGKVTRHGQAIRSALRFLRVEAGDLVAADFGPKALRDVRAKLIESGRLSRRVANRRVQMMVRAFRWGVGEELVNESVPRALACLDPIQRGDVDGLREPQKVEGVSRADVDAVLPHVSRQLQAVIELQLLTGARGGEILTMTPGDIDRVSPKAWLYRPKQHKNAHRGHSRVIGLGPQAQQVLSPFLIGRADGDYLFSPREAEAERLAKKSADRITPMSCGRTPGSHRKANPKKQPGKKYTPSSYGAAVARGCERSGVARWSPHQLRHEAATQMRAAMGLEAASNWLGHTSAEITDSVYAERDTAKILDIAAKVG